MTENKILDKLMNWIGSKLSKPVSFDKSKFKLHNWNAVIGGSYVPTYDGLVIFRLIPSAYPAFCYICTKGTNIGENNIVNLVSVAGENATLMAPMIKGVDYRIDTVDNVRVIEIFEFPFSRLGGAVTRLLQLLSSRMEVVAC